VDKKNRQGCRRGFPRIFRLLSATAATALKMLRLRISLSATGKPLVADCRARNSFRITPVALVAD
jgi:hypothetical protein